MHGMKINTKSFNGTRKAAIEKVNNIDECRSKIVKNRVFNCFLLPNWRQMTIKNTVSSDFDLRWIVLSVCNCCLSGVLMG